MHETFRLMCNKVESVHVDCACNTTPAVRDVLPQVSLTTAAFTRMLEQVQSITSVMFEMQ